MKKLSKIARHGVPPSAHGRACVICGEPFGSQCFGLGVAADISLSLEDAVTAREVCDRCARFYDNAHLFEGSMAWGEWSLRGWWGTLRLWWRCFLWWWPRRHAFDALKYPRGSL